MNFKTFLKLSKIQYQGQGFGLRSFECTSAGQHSSCELRWNNCWMV